MQARKDVFDRVQELEELRVRLQQRRTFLLHGQAGAGKSLLLRTVCPEFPKLIYCQAGNGMQQLCRQLALSLLECGNRAMQSKLGPEPAAKLKSIPSVSLRGIIADALKEGPYRLLLDHFGFASQRFASMLKEWIAESAPIVVVARSAHMEEIGYAASLFVERKDKFMLGNFDAETASRFADWEAARAGLQAENLDEFKHRIVELTRGNPGMIAKLVELAALPRYRSGDHIKVTPLYLDLKLHGSALSQMQ